MVAPATRWRSDMSHDDAHATRNAPTDVSRRTFIKGVIAGGVAVSSAAYLFRNSPLVSGQAARAGSVERLITLTVNGQTRRVDVAPQETLATTLRYKLGLTGTKLAATGPNAAPARCSWTMCRDMRARC